jgi:hypothetical protein
MVTIFMCSESREEEGLELQLNMPRREMKMTWALTLHCRMGKHCPNKFTVVLSVLQHMFSPSCTTIRIKCIEDFTEVPTCFGVLNIPSSGEQWPVFSAPKHVATFVKFYMHSILIYVRVGENTYYCPSN